MDLDILSLRLILKSKSLYIGLRPLADSSTCFLMRSPVQEACPSICLAGGLLEMAP